MRGPYVFKKKILRALAALVDYFGYFIFRPNLSLLIHPKKILVIRLDQMGDIIQTIPLFESLRNKFPEAEITFLTTPLGKNLNNIVGFADRVIEWDCRWFDKKRTQMRSLFSIWEEIKNEKFDCALELRGDVRLILLLWLSRIPHVVGFGCTGGGFLLDREARWNRGEHAIDKNLRLGMRVGAEPVSSIPRIKYGPVVETPKQLAIHPDAGAPSKIWPIEKFVEVIDRLCEKGFKIVLIGTNKQLGQKIEQKIKASVENVMGQTTMIELVGLLGKCCGLLSNDSGPAHLMAALGKPVWILWSGTAESTIWVPRGEKVRLFSHSVLCSPCSLSECPVDGHPCMNQISVDEVVKDLQQYL